MILIAFIVPIVTVLILLIFFKEETTWWEYFAVIFPSLIGTALIVLLVELAKTSDSYYTSELITTVHHEESWNEYIHKTCTRTVRYGKTTTVKTYNCSYVKYHPESWYGKTKSGAQVQLSEGQYKHYVKLWANETFVDMHRHYFTKDGDAYYSSWNDNPKTSGIQVSRESYINYLRGSKNLYSLKELEDSDKVGLYEYPEKSDNTWQGWNPGEGLIRNLGWINSRPESPRVHILVWKNSGNREIMTRQKRYWGNGKCNDVVFMIGLDKKSKIKWIDSFSWSEEPWFENFVKASILPGQSFNPHKLILYIDIARQKKYWKPRDFSKYSYLDVDFDLGDYIIVLIATIIINILISMWVISNEFK